MDRSIDDRLDAVERALTDDHAKGGLPEAADVEARLDALESTVDDVDDRLADLEAAVQALRGFAGGVRAVDESVERRANAALATAERLETELGGRCEDRHADHFDGPNDDRFDDPADESRRDAGSDRPPETTDDSTRPPDLATVAAEAAEAAEADEATGPLAGGTPDATDSTLADRLRRLL